MGDQLDLTHQQHTAAPPNIMNNLLLITIFTILTVVAVSAGPRTRNGSKDVKQNNIDDVSVIKSKFKRKNSVESEIRPKNENKKTKQKNVDGRKKSGAGKRKGNSETNRQKM